jgi:small subunit ribosomal protein S10
MGIVRIKLSSVSIEELNNVVGMINDLSTRAGVMMRGPIPLPTRRMKVTTRKSPCGNGTATFDRFEMRVHKRVIDLPAEERILHPIMMIKIPRSVQIKIETKE